MKLMTFLRRLYSGQLKVVKLTVSVSVIEQKQVLNVTNLSGTNTVCVAAGFERRCLLLYIEFQFPAIPTLPVPVNVRSMLWVFGRSLVAIAVSNPAGCMTVSCRCRLLSGRGVYVGLITRPEKSYRV